MRKTAALIVACSTTLLAGCETIAITAAGIGASTGINHALSGIVQRTFSEPLPKVEKATLRSLNQMGIKVAAVENNDQGKVIKASCKERNVEIELEALTPAATRMVATAKSGWLYDGATATEIVMQTERKL